MSNMLIPRINETGSNCADPNNPNPVDYLDDDIRVHPRRHEYALAPERLLI